MRTSSVEKIVTYLLWISIAIFVLCVIWPWGSGLAAIFKTRKVFYICMTLAVGKAIFLVRKKEESRYLEVLPFLLVFLICCFQLSRFPDYRFGVDDAYYYSYVCSAVIDGDLDLSNQYEHSGLERYLDQKTLESKTPIGRSPNIFPVGLSVFWSPFFLIGYFVAQLAGVSLDGFSRPFLFAVASGNLLFVCAGLYFCYLFCSSFVSQRIALLSTFAVAFTTPHLFLFFRAFLLISEPLSFALAALMLFLLMRSERKNSTWRWFLLGLLLGAMTMVRFHNILFGLAPAAILIYRARKEGVVSQLPRLAGAFAIGTFIGFFPQLIAWRFIYGSWFLSMAGSFLPWWKSPFLLETLFSSRKGLLPWSPITLFCLCGLPLLWRKNRVWGFALMVVVLATTYINSAQADWWGATSLGARRFVPLVTILAAGFASLFSRIPRPGKLALFPLLIAFLFLNGHFVRAFLRGDLQSEHADRFSDILQGPYLPFQYVVYPLEFPVQMAYHLKYGAPLYGPLTEFFIGEDVFYFQDRAQGEILSKDSPLFGQGWQVQNGVRTTKGRDAFVYVPLFLKEKPRFVMEFNFEPTGTEKDIWVDFYWNGEFLRSRKVFVDGRVMEMAIRSREYGSPVNTLRMHIYHSKAENEEAPELILHKIYFRRAEGKPGNLDMVKFLVH